MDESTRSKLSLICGKYRYRPDRLFIPGILVLVLLLCFAVSYGHVYSYFTSQPREFETHQLLVSTQNSHMRAMLSHENSSTAGLIHTALESGVDSATADSQTLKIIPLLITGLAILTLLVLILSFFLWRRKTLPKTDFDKTIAEANTLFTTAFDRSPLMMAISLIPDCQIDLVNDAMVRTLGLERDEILGQTMTELGLLDARTKAQSLEQIQRSGQSQMNIEFVDADGMQHYGILSANLIRYQDYQASLVIIEDTTRSRLTERALKESELRFRTIFEHSYTGMILTNFKGEVITANNALEKIIGYTRNELKNVSFRSFSYPEDMPDEEVLLGQIRDGTSDGFQYKKRLVRKDGSLVWIEIAVNVIRDEEGKPNLFVGVITDISDKLKAERDHQKLQRLLQQSQKMEAIGQLTGGIAHDFNNILASILGFAELSRTQFKNDIPEKLDSYLAEIISVGMRARKIVEQLLTFTRGNNQDIEEIDPVPAIKTSIEFIRSTIPSTVNLNLTTDCASQKIFANKFLLDQILLNLILNARQAINDSGKIDISCKIQDMVHIDCASCHKEIHGRFFALEICDDGPGIAGAMIERVFEPFFTTREYGQNHGMGLSVIHGIMHSLKGHIRIFPSHLGGACIQLLFPLDDLSDQATPVTDAEDIPARQRHVLVVDDELPITELIREILEQEDLRITCFQDPRPALQAFYGNPQDVDLLITDQTMPGMSGIELAQQLTRMRPELPVLICTGYNQDITEDKLNQLQTHRVLYKPIKNQQLIATVEDMLRTEGR